MKKLYVVLIIFVTMFMLTGCTSKEEIPFNQGADITDLIQPGDIVVRRGDKAGHVAIVVEPLEDGAESYDCGNAGNWTNSGGNPIFKDKFYTGVFLAGAPQLSAHGKIIRVTAP